MKKIFYLVSLGSSIITFAQNINFQDNMEFSEILKKAKTENKIIFLDAYASWCGPCKILSPRVAEIANENKDIKVVKINVDQNEDLARKYNISSMPTLLVIENGKELNRAVGALSKSTVLKFVREAK